MILDSSFLIDLMADDAGARAKLDELVADATPLTVSSLSVTEVRRGLRRTAAREQFDDVMGELTVVPYGYPEARRAADLLRRLDEAGDAIGAVDAMIAATALERDEKLLTRNLHEFRRVDGLRASPY